MIDLAAQHPWMAFFLVWVAIISTHHTIKVVVRGWPPPGEED